MTVRCVQTDRPSQHSKCRELRLPACRNCPHLESSDDDAFRPQPHAAEQERRARHQEHCRYAERHASEDSPAQCQHAHLYVMRAIGEWR